MPRHSLSEAALVSAVERAKARFASRDIIEDPQVLEAHEHVSGLAS
jgi:hypothetical protein